MWECPALKDTQLEEDPDLQLLNPLNTPTHTLLGLPTHLPADEGDLLIEPVSGYRYDEGNDGILSFGTALQPHIYSYLCLLPHFDGITATRLIHRYNCHTAGPPFVNVLPCSCIAPAEPNAFTDGSLSASCAPFGFGGYGIWFPHRRECEVGINELEFAHFVNVGPIHGATGVATAGMMLEPFTSSTRCEAAALINCVTSAGSVHIATDSANAADFANQLLSGEQLRKPIQLCSDGDLWAAFLQACIDKGPGSVRVSWTKGHTSLSSMLRGEHCPRAAVHNSIADKAADGGLFFEEDHAKAGLMHYYAAKQKARYKLFAAIHRRIARVCTKAAELRKEKEEAIRSTKGNPASVPTPAPPSHPSRNYLTISLIAPPPIQGDYHTKLLHYHLRVFWSTIFLVPAGDSSSASITQHGTTWLELFLIFSLNGGLLLKQQFADYEGSHINPRFNALFKAFVKTSKQLLFFAKAQDKPLFAPVLTRARPLLPYGITTFLSMISATVAIQGEVARGLHRALCAIGGRVSSTTATPAKLRLGPFRPPQLFPWAQVSIGGKLHQVALRRLQASIAHAQVPAHDPSNSQTLEVTPRPTSFILSCPGCRCKKDTKHTRLYHHTNKPCILHCKNCHKSSSSRRWQCSCCIPWFTCPTHRTQGFACRPIQRASNGHSDGAGQEQADGLGHEHHDKPVKRPRIIFPIRSMGNFSNSVVNYLSNNIANRQLDLTPATVPTLPLNRGKRPVSLSFVEPSSKRRSLAFTPGPKLSRRIALFDEDAD